LNPFQSRIPASFGHFPDGTSSLVLAHLAQRVDLRNFAFYDYGAVKNNKVYGQSKPPKYDLSKIDSGNMILISGVNDFLADPTDIDIVRSQLTGRKCSYSIVRILYESIIFNVIAANLDLI